MTDADVAAFRAALEDGGCIGVEEAESLMSVERLVSVASDAWGSFYVDTLTAHLVWECRPTGRISAAQADWLDGQLDQPRVAPPRLAAMLLASVVSEAVDVDERVLMRALSENRFAGASTPAAEALKAA